MMLVAEGHEDIEDGVGGRDLVEVDGVLGDQKQENLLYFALVLNSFELG